MKPRLFLHIGTHNTATSSLQDFCNLHRSELLARRVHYPELPLGNSSSRFKHHDFAHALAGTSSHLLPEDGLQLPWLWKGFAVEHDLTTLISVEPVWRHTLNGDEGMGWMQARERYLDRLADALQPFDTTVVAVFRRPDDFMEASYLKRLANSANPANISFQSHCERGLTQIARYYDNISLFSDRFALIKGLIFEELTKEGLYEPFFTALGMDVSGFSPPGTNRQNPSAAECLVLNAMKSMEPIMKRSKRLKECFNSDEVQFVLSDYLTANAGRGLWESPDARAAFLRACDPQINLLREAHFPGRDSLFPALTRTDTPPCVEPPSEGLLKEVDRAARAYFKRMAAIAQVAEG